MTKQLSSHHPFSLSQRLISVPFPCLLFWLPPHAVNLPYRGIHDRGPTDDVAHVSFDRLSLAVVLLLALLTGDSWNTTSLAVLCSCSKAFSQVTLVALHEE